MKKLDVSFNGFGTEGAAFMGQALAANRTLLELDMSKNRITNIDITLLANKLKGNDTLQVIRVNTLRYAGIRRGSFGRIFEYWILLFVAIPTRNK